MNFKQTMALASELYELSELTAQANTPDGRWELLQQWLRDHPKWKRNVEQWARETPEAAYSALFDYLCEQAEMPPVFLRKLITIEIEARTRGAIECVQGLYRERANLKPKRKRKVIESETEKHNPTQEATDSDAR